jgi:quercetin dioxygenase-like cupin family protein
MSEQQREPGYTSGTAERAAHNVQAPVQLIHLNDVAAQVREEQDRRDVDHTAYTLRNSAALRQVLLTFRAGGRMDDHHADGGVAIHVLDGEVAVQVQGSEYVLGAGDLLDLAPGLRHNVQGRRDSLVLLTIAPVGSVAHPGSPRDQEGQ